ncbi:ABC transporter permease [Saccharobesus litoralis]|nr:ABC transporter permease [Saccharobesus litoralis]
MLNFIRFAIELITSSFKALSNRTLGRQVFMVQVFFSGFEALSLVCLVSALLGGLVMYIGYDFFVSIGQPHWIYTILNTVLLRDLAPFLICFILLARSGSAISTELGNMKVNKEVAALNVMGIGTMSYLVLPRVWGMVTSIFILGCFFSTVGILSANLIALLFLNVSHIEFWNAILGAISVLDIVFMAIKLCVSGFLIATLSCYFGLKVESAVTQVPQYMIKTVGFSVLSVSLINGLGIVVYLLFFGRVV